MWYDTINYFYIHILYLYFIPITCIYIYILYLYHLFIPYIYIIIYSHPLPLSHIYIQYLYLMWQSSSCVFTNLDCHVWVKSVLVGFAVWVMPTNIDKSINLHSSTARRYKLMNFQDNTNKESVSLAPTWNTARPDLSLGQGYSCIHIQVCVSVCL